MPPLNSILSAKPAVSLGDGDPVLPPHSRPECGGAFNELMNRALGSGAGGSNQEKIAPEAEPQMVRPARGRPACGARPTGKTDRDHGKQVQGSTAAHGESSRSEATNCNSPAVEDAGQGNTRDAGVKLADGERTEVGAALLPVLFTALTPPPAVPPGTCSSAGSGHDLGQSALCTGESDGGDTPLSQPPVAPTIGTIASEPEKRAVTQATNVRNDALDVAVAELPDASASVAARVPNESDKETAPPESTEAAAITSKQIANEEESADKENFDGISAAQQSGTMKKADKMPKIAGSEKDLPGHTMITDRAELSVGSELSSGSTPCVEHVTAATGANTSTAAPSLESAVASGVSTLAAMRAHGLERTHDLVALHALRLRETGAESLHVVLKPGPGLQLSLELHARDGCIEAQARLQRGDYDLLSRHWADLQQRLEVRGVRLAPLSCETNLSGDTSHFHQPRLPGADTDPLAAGAFAEFALAGSLTEPPAAMPARLASHRGWETWA